MRRPMDTNGNQHFYFDSFCLVRLNSTDAINNFSLALRFSLTSCGGRIFQYVLKNYLMFVSNFSSAFPILFFVKKSNQMLHFSRHFFHIFFFCFRFMLTSSDTFCVDIISTAHTRTHSNFIKLKLYSSQYFFLLFLFFFFFFFGFFFASN